MILIENLRSCLMATLEKYFPRLQSFIESQTGYTMIKPMQRDCIYRSLCMIAYQKMVGGLWEGQIYLVGHNIVFCLGLHGAKVIIGMPVHPEVPAYFFL